MSIGDGIFFSAILLSVVGLYAATKDRWNWKRIAKWGIGAPVALGAFLATGLWGYSTYENRSTKQTQFEGVSLSSSSSDVRFLKGEPIHKNSSEDLWVYDAHSGSSQSEDAVLLVQFRNERIRHITYWANERQIVNPYLLGFTIGSNYEAVLQKLGEPSNVSTSADGLNRVLSFEKYNCFFEFQRGRVRTFGIYDPAGGPVKFSQEADHTTSSASPASK
jgi:hypothetical protein